MTKVYCYSKCTTCKKALKWLDDNKIEHTVIDIKEDVIHHCMNDLSKAIKEKEQDRFEKLCEEFGM